MSYQSDRAPRPAPPAPCDGDGLYQPRALRGDTELGRTLIALEVPDCRCPLERTCECPGCVPPRSKAARRGWRPCACCRGECLCPLVPCPHVREADHGLAPEKWLALLLAFDREGYAPELGPAPAALALLRVDRVLLREVRAERGQRLYNRADVLRARRAAVKAASGKREGGLSVLPVMNRPDALRPEEGADVLSLAARAALARERPPEHPRNPLRHDEAVPEGGAA